MNTLLISTFVMALLTFPMNHKNNVDIDSLDGTSLTYKYQDLGTVKLNFGQGLITYEWLDGPFKGMIGKDYPYKAKKIARKIYLVQWFESERSSLVSLAINFKENTVDSSALLNPDKEDEAVLFHHATIQKQNLVEK